MVRSESGGLGKRTRFVTLKTTTRRQSSQVLLPQLALAVVLLLLVVSFTFAQNDYGETSRDDKVWTWKNSEGEVKTAADLKTILLQHSLWLNSMKEKGSQANLSSAHLERANL